MELTIKKANELMKDNGSTLYLSGTQITSLPENLTVGSTLYLSGTQITSLPENLTVGGTLYLSGTQITSLPENLTVGGSLYLRDTQITSLPENLTVGGSLDLSGTQITNKVYKRLSQGDYVKNNYIYADGVLTHIKKEKKSSGYTFYVGKIKGRNVVFDGKNYAHCKTFKDGIIDLKFKEAKNRGQDQYKSLGLNSVLKLEEAITMYRIITGACQQGTENFVSSLKEVKEEYSIQEIINLTKHQYNNEVLQRFFKEE